MNVSSANSVNLQALVPETPEAKRAALQAMLLRKSLEVFQESASTEQNTAEGKGGLIDIRA